MAAFDVSVAVIVWLPAVLRVTVNVAVPSSDEGKVKVAGKEAWGSLLVKSIVPVKLVSVVPLGVRAVTVRLNELPAVCGLAAVNSSVSCGAVVPTSELATRLARGVPRPVT